MLSDRDHDALSQFTHISTKGQINTTLVAVSAGSDISTAISTTPTTHTCHEHTHTHTHTHTSDLRELNSIHPACDYGNALSGGWQHVKVDEVSHGWTTMGTVL